MQKGMPPRALLVARRLGLQDHEIPVDCGRNVLTVQDLRRFLSKRRLVEPRPQEALSPEPWMVQDVITHRQRMSFFYELPTAGLAPTERGSGGQEDWLERWAVYLVQAIAQACPHIPGLRADAASQQDWTVAYVSRDGWAVLPSREAAQAEAGRIKALLQDNSGKSHNRNDKVDIVIRDQMGTRNGYFCAPGGDGELTLWLGRPAEQVVEKQPGSFEIIPAVSVSMETSVAQASAALRLLRRVAQQLAQGA